MIESLRRKEEKQAKTLKHLEEKKNEEVDPEQAEAAANTYETEAKVRFQEREKRETNKKPHPDDHKKYM